MERNSSMMKLRPRASLSSARTITDFCIAERGRDLNCASARFTLFDKSVMVCKGLLHFSTDWCPLRVFTLSACS